MITKYENNIVRLIGNWSAGSQKFDLEDKKTYYYKSHYYVRSELVSTLPLEELIKHKPNKLDPKDKVYFTKSSTIPRYKLKEHLEQNKIEINKTNRIASANTYVVGLNAYKTLIYSNDAFGHNTNKYFVVPVNDIIQYCERGFKVKAFDRNITEVLVPYSYKDSNHSFATLSNYPTTQIIPVEVGWGAAKANDILESFVYIANKSTTPKIVFDETLLEDCNTGIVIDHEIYENLRGMLEGKNKDNISMAMEIMSNSDYNESKLYLLMLLNEFGYRLRQVPKTVNYQSLLNYFIEYKDTMSNNWERFSDHMLNRVCKTDDDKEIIKRYILDCFNRFLKNSKTKFTLNDIVIN
jgi:hypothetical protein